ncbi:MAG: helix-turn-helix domain-containing protein [Clostridia bacterium]|nr:helix-turn-helix domain-containing protein [Clostridia bacterium]
MITLHWKPKLLANLPQGEIFFDFLDTTETEETISNTSRWFDHSHSDYYEFWLYLSGEIRLLKEGELYTPISGDILYFAPGESHRGIVQKPCMLSRVVMMISCKAVRAFEADGFDIIGFCKDASLRGKPCVLRMPENEQQQMIQLISESRAIVAKMAIASTKLQGDASVYGNFLRLFALLNEVYFTCGNQLFTPPSTGIIREACDYIDANYLGIENLSEVAEALHVNYSYLSSKFSRMMAVTMTDYLNYRKISRSRFLLASGNSVSEACDASGFSSISYYIKLFKKLYGITPGAYAMQLKDANE